MFELKIGKDDCDNESSHCVHIANHFDWLDESTVLLTWYVLGCDKINVPRHGEKELNTINKHYINIERDILILFL